MGLVLCFWTTLKHIFHRNARYRGTIECALFSDLTAPPRCDGVRQGASPRALRRAPPRRFATAAKARWTNPAEKHGSSAIPSTSWWTAELSSISAATTIGRARRALQSAILRRAAILRRGVDLERVQVCRAAGLRGGLDFALHKPANVAHGDCEIVLSLQVNPELRSVAK